jgi:N-acetylated-alpha-linked acidic dipeptidase
MRGFFRTTGVMLLLSLALAAQAQTTSPLLGFMPARAAEQQALEKRFDSLLSRENLREWMQRLTARPHHVGSTAGRENAQFLAEQLRSWGYDTRIEEFRVLFPTPKQRRLELVRPGRYTARIAEPRLREDATSGIDHEQLPVYNAYSVDGDVTGELVYVNYGVPKDYETLEERGISVRGKIVLARYGGSWRGIKPKVAAEHGAIGCLIFSDPKDDGYYQGDVYPKGAYRNEWGAQRGSVADMPLYPGDPLTPGVGATKDARRLPIQGAPTLTKIPVMPISYGDALPLLRALEGPVAPEEWRGALPVTYHMGPGPAVVHLELRFDWKLVPCYDVIATLRGAERPDEWVIRANHHDAWNLGADDPVSGTVAVLEEARATAELVKSGWRPKRSIVFALWDGEEPGLLGSTEWCETHAELLSKNAVLYVNSDNNGRGFLRAGGSHTLERFVDQIARDVTDPQKGISVRDRLRANRRLRGVGNDRREAADRPDIRLNALGSGSDYTPFLQHLGIASLDLRYSGENTGGSYHSIYDSFDHYTRFGDPNFDYGIALAQTAGRAVLRCADADVLPFEYTRLAVTVNQYVGEITRLAKDMREATEERNRLIADKVYEAAADPKEPHVTPRPQTPVPPLEFAPIGAAVAHLQQSAAAYDRAMGVVVAGEHPLPPDRQAALDAQLVRIDRAMLRPEGLPRRPWFRHQIYAPGFYTGYGVKTLPGVREAVEERKWAEAVDQIRVVAGTLEAVAQEIDRAVRMVRE